MHAGRPVCPSMSVVVVASAVRPPRSSSQARQGVKKNANEPKRIFTEPCPPTVSSRRPPSAIPGNMVRKVYTMRGSGLTSKTAKERSIPTPKNALVAPTTLPPIPVLGARHGTMRARIATGRNTTSWLSGRDALAVRSPGSCPSTSCRCSCWKQLTTSAKEPRKATR